MNIICNDCLGGELYKIYDEQYQNPFIWTIITIDDFIKLYTDYSNINFNKAEYNETPQCFFSWWISNIKIDNKVSIWYPHHLHLSEHKEPTKVEVLQNVLEVPWNAMAYEKMDDYLMAQYYKRLMRMNAEPIFVFTQEERDNDRDLIKLLTAKSQYKLIFLARDGKYKVYETDKVKVLMNNTIPNEVNKQVKEAKLIQDNLNDFIKN